MIARAGTTVRSIGPDETETWGRLGGDDIVEAARSFADTGSSGPDRWLVAERDGHAVGRLGVFVEDAGCGLDVVEHNLFGIWLGDGSPETITATASALARATVATLPPGRQTIDLRSNPERHRDIEARRAPRSISWWTTSRAALPRPTSTRAPCRARVRHCPSTSATASRRPAISTKVRWYFA